MIAAKTTEAAVAILEPTLLKKGVVLESGPKIVMATVKGDIHDIGKNIVTLLMKSAGFTVYDIGVDQDADIIIKKAKEVNADIIGLSAVLTTTMLRMKEKNCTTGTGLSKSGITIWKMTRLLPVPTK